jgi:hypothetical protein
MYSGEDTFLGINKKFFIGIALVVGAYGYAAYRRNIKT